MHQFVFFLENKCPGALPVTQRVNILAHREVCKRGCLCNQLTSYSLHILTKLNDYMPFSKFIYEKSRPYPRQCYRNCKTERGAKMAGRCQHHPSITSAEVKKKPYVRDRFVVQPNNLRSRTCPWRHKNVSDCLGSAWVKHFQLFLSKLNWTFWQYLACWERDIAFLQTRQMCSFNLSVTIISFLPSCQLN